MTEKFLKIFAAASSLVIGLSVFSSCGAQLIDETDSSKTQIKVNVYNGGNGVEWIKKLARDYNEKNADSGYEIRIIDNLKYTNGDIVSEITTGTDTAVYYTVEPGIKDMISRGLLEDMSDVYDMKADGEDGQTIGEKMQDKELVKKVFSGKGGKGLYAIPYSNSFLGLVYEHERFLDNGWYNFADGTSEEVKNALTAQGIRYTVSGKSVLFESADGKTNYTAGDRILTAGKDGKYGTYDDGQPITLDEWATLLNKICSKGGYPFLWEGMSTGYLDDIITSMYAQYDGLDNYSLFSSYDGRYVSPSTGTETVITPETGYKIFGLSEGLKKGTEFVDEYFSNNEKYVHPFSTYTSTSHRDAQDKFVYGYKNDGEVYLTGMLADGIWWENEARASFKSLADSGETDRAYGLKEFRYMLLPTMEGQKGIDGSGKGSVFAVRDSGAIIIRKNNDKKLVEEAKKFIAYTTSDESMRYFTKTTGVVRPYEYDLTEQDLSEMTPFSRNVWQMVKDKENIAFVKPFMNNNVCSINYASGKSPYIYQTTYEGVAYVNPFDVLKKTTAANYVSSLVSEYSEQNWKTLYNKAISAWGDIG